LHANYSSELKSAFVLGDEELRKLSRLLSERIGGVEYSAQCSDDVARTFTTLAELVNYENAKASHIRGLCISARSADYSKSATIRMSDSKQRCFSLDIDAREDVVARLRADVLNVVSGMSPWYAAFHQVNFLLILSAVALALSLARPAGVAATRIPISLAVAAIILLGAAGFVLNRLRDRVFPRAVFLIGQGKARYQHLERCHWGIGIAFVVSFLAGLVIAVWQWLFA
jgi:hypothetical protein